MRRTTTPEPRVIAVPPRLLVHQGVHQLVDELEAMQRVAFVEAGGEPTEFSRRVTDAVVNKSVPNHEVLRALGCEHAVPQLLSRYVTFESLLGEVLEHWVPNLLIDGVEYAGTSLEFDYRQAGPPGNWRIGPVGSSSVHGAVLVFGCELRDATRPASEAARRPTASEVGSAWRLLTSTMTVAELDGAALWAWMRQELDAEYARLMPLPAPATSVGSAAPPRTPDWQPSTRDAGDSKPPQWQPEIAGEWILVALEHAGDIGLKTWDEIGDRIEKLGGCRYANGTLRDESDGLKKPGWIAKHEGSWRLLEAGRERLALLRSPNVG